MNELDFIEHPEGGRFKEIYRSNTTVQTKDKTRTALTHIYFSLNKNECSRFHRVESDEIWNLYEGDGLQLYIWDDMACKMENVLLAAENQNYCHVIKAGLWQATVPLSSKVLVGCSVAPGFEFDDFLMIDQDKDVAGRILEHQPQLSHLIIP